jgi:hypothetical protein
MGMYFKNRERLGKIMEGNIRKETKLPSNFDVA